MQPPKDKGDNMIQIGQGAGGVAALLNTGFANKSFAHMDIAEFFISIEQPKGAVLELIKKNAFRNV
jgi:hypothetical protein